MVRFESKVRTDWQKDPKLHDALPSIYIDFAKKCPVKWAKIAKADNINLPLYSYGAVTEIEAALSGRGDPMSVEVLLAKIRHLKNTFEVCCLNSSSTDFCTYV